MGQSSLPIGNKLGVSMRWDASYDNLINFKKQFLFDVFLKKFFDYIFEDKLIFFFFKFFFKKNLNFFFFSNFFKLKKKRVISYLSKIWVLKYQGWYVVSFYLYVPKVFLKKNLSLKQLKTSNNFSFIKFLCYQNINYKNIFKYQI